MSRSRIPNPICLDFPLLLGLLVELPPNASKNDMSLEDSQVFWFSGPDPWAGGDEMGDRSRCVV
jgi:hypothetical protein